MTRPTSPRPAAAPPGDAEAVLSQAQALWRAERAGTARPWLKGRRFGLLCDDADSADALLFRRAATELGAHVSHVRPTLTPGTPAHEVEATARLLGRLYDALECQCASIDLATLSQLRSVSGVPVYEGLATEAHPTARLAERLDASIALPDRRRIVVEAVLVNALN